MSEIDVLIRARWMLKLDGTRTVIENAALAMAGDKIVYAGPAAEAPREAAEIVELGQHVLLPGLVNAHGHAAMTLFRGLADDLPLMTWLQEHIWPAEGQWVSGQFVEDGTRLAIAEMLRSGTTTFSDMYFFPEVASRVAEAEGMRVQICCPLMDFPTPWGQGPDDYLEKTVALAAQWRGSNWVQVALGPHAPYTVSDEPFRKVVAAAQEHDLPIQVHLQETAVEVEQAIANTGKRPTQRLAELGVLNPRTQCVHMTQIDETDLAILKETGAHIVHCPESNLKLASGICPVNTLLEHGINVALGTDGAASNNDLDMFGEMQTAALIAKVQSNDAAAVNAWQALEMATMGGARALGLADRIGSLEPGKFADVIAVDMGDLFVQPVYNLHSHLVYSMSARQVSDVWTAGKRRLANGRLTSLDTAALRERIADWQARIKS
ncbi:TRZ/ATZ family hydrolase [Hahella sp. SMD15-11]|uniref:5-methylthioadenosine/S-adenosylhomocysteine deaminase n=1 Tax=Thermohahella caldifontis TaxID=3142973 RepID=A0AB39UX71_9GAMM